MSEKFDVIVVGAGPAGISCAYTLAKAGVNVLLIERGEFPGSKNVMGGILYSKMMRDIIPEFYKEAPLERPIIEQKYMLLDEKSATTMGHRNLSWGEEPYNNFSVFRAKFDEWFANKAVAAGAVLINETVVKECIIEDGRVIGVRTDRPDGDVYADVVVLADGVNSLLAKSLGFHRELRPDQVALAAMEVLKLDSKTIEDRFSLEANQGCAFEIFGDSTKGMLGTAWLYTNKDSVSIGVGTMLSSLSQHKVKPYELLDYVKNHPIIRPYIQGGEQQEYLAHLIPEGGYNAIPKLVGNGVMVVGDAAQLVNAIHREGSNLAMTSGRMAAETIIQARMENDYSEKSLDQYRSTIFSSFIGQDLKKYKDASHYLENNPRYFEEYIPLLNNAMGQMFTIDGTSKWDKQKKIVESVGSKVKMASDLYKAWKVIK